MSQSDVREYAVSARSTDTFGRVLCTCGNHHFVVDGPVQNGCPGEEVTPAEIFLSGVAACGVELLQVIAKAKAVPLSRVHVAITGLMDKQRPVRPDLTVFNSVRIAFTLAGVTRAQGLELVEAFKGR